MSEAPAPVSSDAPVGPDTFVAWEFKVPADAVHIWKVYAFLSGVAKEYTGDVFWEVVFL